MMAQFADKITSLGTEYVNETWTPTEFSKVRLMLLCAPLYDTVQFGLAVVHIVDPILACDNSKEPIAGYQSEIVPQ